MSQSPYVFPLGPKATYGRIDQGVDFGGKGPVKAIGKALIVRTGAPGWPGGENGILYKLLEGADAGKYVYVNEALKVAVKAGQHVSAGQTIGHLIPGSATGIEMGWADRNGVPISHSEYTEGKETKGGKSFRDFLKPLLLSAAAQNKPNELEEAEHSPQQIKKNIEGTAGEAAGGIASAVEKDLLGGLAKHAEPLMLNIALVGGGAFLVYYGAALLLGVKSPGPVKTAAVAAK